MKKILIVDDEPDILEFLGYNLRNAGYEVMETNNGKSAIEIAKDYNPDLIILDVMMPEMDGIETCYLIKENPEIKDVLICFLTARSEDFSQIAGLDSGADDYLTKPIKPKVFLSKIKSILRRKIGSQSIEKQTYGDIVINFETKQLLYKGENMDLTKKEFGLLNLLCSKPGRVFSREEILRKVWGYDIVVGNRTIDVHIKKLRDKTSNHHIKTVKGFGYKFVLNEKKTN